MNIKKIKFLRIKILTLAFALLFVVTACGPQKPEAAIKMVALKGPTSMGLAKLFKDQKEGKSESLASYTIAASPDQAVTAFTSGEADLVTVPSNLAALLYKKLEGDVQVLHINTLGVLYVVDPKGQVHSLEDLKGRTLYASGKGASPEYILSYLLDEKGIDRESIKISWQQDHTQCLQALTKDPEGLALLPQPFVTVAQTKMKDLKVALDLTREWDRAQEGKDPASALVMGVTIARKSFVDRNKALIDLYLKEARESLTYVLDHSEEASRIIDEDLDIIKAPIAQKALPHCNLVYIDGQEMKDKLGGYLSVLQKEDPKSVGGELPGDDFYYFSK